MGKYTRLLYANDRRITNLNSAVKEVVMYKKTNYMYITWGMGLYEDEIELLEEYVYKWTLTRIYGFTR